MYAIIKTGGKQYRVQSGEQVRVESLTADVGSAISFDQVLMVGAGDGVRVGAPLVSGAQVKATVLGHGRGDKVKIFKLRRRKTGRGAVPNAVRSVTGDASRSMRSFRSMKISGG